MKSKIKTRRKTNESLKEKIKELRSYDKYKNDIRNWLENEYEKGWDVPLIENIKNANKSSRKGLVNRIVEIMKLKYRYLYNSMDTIVTVIKLHVHNSNESINIATIFSEQLDTMSESGRKFISSNNIYDNTAYTYYSISPSYTSCDGEYRNELYYFTLYDSIQLQFPDILNDITDYVTKIISRRRWSISYKYFYPTMEHEKKNTQTEYKARFTLLYMHILSLSWFNTINNYMENKITLHINEKYKKIILNEEYIDNDIDFIKKLYKIYSKSKMEDFSKYIKRGYKSLFDPDKIGQKIYPSLRVGFKMVPLSVKDVQEPLKLNSTPWREYLISNRLNDIVINNISPGFSITLDWFYIRNQKSGLYDNKSQSDKIKHSAIAKEILSTLRNAQRGTYFAQQNLQLKETSSDNIKKWISNKFKVLYNKILDPINYTTEDIIVSEVTLAFMNQYLGRTVADNLNIIKNNKNIDNKLGNIFTEKGKDYFAKYIFEICYNLLVLHKRLEVIHGDLHLNNITIGKLFDTNIVDKNLKTTYVLNNDFQYVFPYNGNFASIIDFSRSIINYKDYSRFNINGLPQIYKIVNDKNEFASQEVNRLTNLILKMYPLKINNKDELLIICKNNFDLVFKLMSIIDVYTFSYKLKHYMQELNIKLHKESNTLLNNIINQSKNFSDKVLNIILKNDIDTLNKYSESWPTEDIIKNNFTSYIGKISKNDVITDIFSLNSSIDYNLDLYEHYPPMIQSVMFKKDNKLHSVDIINKNRKEVQNDHNKIKNKNLETMDYISMRHKQRL